jgi:hypothetical protein
MTRSTRPLEADCFVTSYRNREQASPSGACRPRPFVPTRISKGYAQQNESGAKPAALRPKANSRRRSPSRCAEPKSISADARRALVLEVLLEAGFVHRSLRRPQLLLKRSEEARITRLFKSEELEERRIV